MELVEMILQIILIALVGYERLSHGELVNKTRPQVVTNPLNSQNEVHENWQNLFDSMSRNDTKKSETHHEMLKQHVARERQVSNAVKQELQIARIRNAERKRTLQSENVVLAKPRTDNPDATVDYDDVSLSNDMIDSLTKDAAESNRSAAIAISRAKQVKFKKSQQYEFNEFFCGCYHMKVLLENASPNFRDPEDHRFLTEDIENEIPFIRAYRDAVFQFRESQLRFNVTPAELAEKRMIGYYDTMFALLLRCNNSHYKTALSPSDMAKAVALRKAVLRYHELDETSSADAQRSAFNDFSEFYGRNQYICTAVANFQFGRLLFDLQTPLSRKVQLVEVLERLGILKAWGPTQEDVDYANMLSDIGTNDPDSGFLLVPGNRPLFYSRLYNFTTNDEEEREGVLPYVTSSRCDHL